MADADHTAVGQALGFVYQFERATYRLLEANTTIVSVGVEHVDDVSVHRSDGTSTREQDKSTIRDARPLTDRSTALWKTLAIWAQAILEDPTRLSTTEFHLVTNGEISPTSLARRIHDAKTRVAMDAVASELQTMTLDLREELSPFGTVVREIPLGMLAALVGQTFAFDKVTASFGGKLEEIPSLRYFGEHQRVAVFDGAMGWVRRAILSTALQGQPTLVDRVAFDREVRGLVRRVQAAPLAAIFDPSSAVPVDPTNYKQHGFFQQLEWIDTEPEFARECVIHYAHAKAARVKWTDADAVSEASLRSYEEDLKSRWKLHLQKQSLSTFPSPEVKGRALLFETLSVDVAFDGQVMPRPITCGNYHALADFDAKKEPALGWHPEYKTRVKGSKGES
jgi:hypothetical protein